MPGGHRKHAQPGWKPETGSRRQEPQVLPSLNGRFFNVKNLFYFNEEIKNMRKKPRVGLETKRTVPKKASRAERFLGNFAWTARLERAGDVEGEDRKSEPGTESPTLAK